MTKRWCALAIRAHIAGAIDFRQHDPTDVRQRLRERIIYEYIENELLAASGERMLKLGIAALLVSDPESVRERYDQLVSLHNTINRILLPWLVRDQWNTTARLVHDVVELLKKPDVRKQLLENEKLIKKKVEENKRKMDQTHQIAEMMNRLSR